MSTRFTVLCNTCEVAGPHIRRHHDKGILMEEGSARFFSVSEDEQAARDWGGFLIEHEYHELTLETEYHSKLARQEQERAREEAQKSTHQLMPDGSLELL